MANDSRTATTISIVEDQPSDATTSDALHTTLSIWGRHPVPMVSAPRLSLLAAIALRYSAATWTASTADVEAAATRYASGIIRAIGLQRIPLSRARLLALEAVAKAEEERAAAAQRLAEILSRWDDSRDIRPG